MDIGNIKVSHRRTPPGACVEFIGKDGQTIEVELRGDEFVDMADDEIIRRAKTTIGDVSPIAEA
jgi:hypothetical protein